MPVIATHILKGRGVEIKRRLASALTTAMADVLELPAESIHVLITEHDRENWAIGGELFSERVAPQPPELDLDTLFRKPTPAKETKAISQSAAKAPPRKAPAKSRPRR
ncbi:MAG TPA: 2-hydroxymuconate tautomerase family protein [Rhizomicrobium sp.]|jgi:4-oxalocrotonate tautomerase|nr:2-hydroxymuconate tautomerase family protein [Rhizomicrobium sp.]